MHSSTQPIQRAWALKAGLTQQAPLLVRLIVSTHWTFYLQKKVNGDTKVALTDTIYEKVRSSFFPAGIRFALKTEKGRRGYLCNYGLCWPLSQSSTLFSLSNSVLPKKTDFWPTRERSHFYEWSSTIRQHKKITIGNTL